MRYTHHRVGLLLVTLLFTAVLWLSSCTEEKEVIRTVETVVTDTVFVEIISVDSIFAIPDSITEGGSIRLTATTTPRPEVGSSLSFAWFADAGTFDQPEGDTVTWKAPDDPGAYTISVHVTDGVFIGLGNRRIGVGMFAPTTTPYYLAVEACGACHAGLSPDIWAGYPGTAHAHAWQTLQESGNVRDNCIPCHTVGFAPEPNNGNGGYDEAPIEKFRNVQCENCHGAGSDHVAGGGDITKIQVDFSAELCAECHQGQHHPFYDEWVTSPHNFDTPRLGSCGGCHEGVAASIRLSGESKDYPLGAGNFYGGGEITERPDVSEVPAQPHTCPTCHNPHSAENPHQLRTVREVQLVTANGESPVITEGGVGRLCMQCHHARYGPDDQVVEGRARFGPHHNPQADMLKAASAYHKVAPPDFPWAGPSHLLIENSCKTCHLDMQEFIPGVGATKGHRFLPTVEACAYCHGPIEDFDDIKALEDFDGNGKIEGIQSEVRGLLKLLEEALVADGLDTTGVGIEGALGDTLRSTLKQRESGYNWLFVTEDRSKGIHNPDYAVQLLQQSLQHLTGQPLRKAVIAKGNHQVVGKW